MSQLGKTTYIEKETSNYGPCEKSANLSLFPTFRTAFRYVQLTLALTLLFVMGRFHLILLAFTLRGTQDI